VIRSVKLNILSDLENRMSGCSGFRGSMVSIGVDKVLYILIKADLRLHEVQNLGKVNNSFGRG
jgi:hypothetical protein